MSQHLQPVPESRPPSPVSSTTTAASRPSPTSATKHRNDSKPYHYNTPVGQSTTLPADVEGGRRTPALGRPRGRSRASSIGIYSLNSRTDVQAHECGQPEEKERERDPNLIIFDGPDDPLNPQNWPLRKKIGQTLLLGLTTLVVTFASSVFSSATSVVAAQFGVSTVVGTLGTSLFVLGYAVGPLIWGPLSEFQGRQIPLIVSYLAFAIFNIPVAVAQNLHTIMICRFFGGVFASGPLAIVGGALSDFWEAELRGAAIAVFAIATFGGPALGPVIGNFVTESYLGWRWTAYLTAIWGFGMVVLCVFLYEESYVPVLLSRKAKKIRYETKNWAIHAKLDEKQFEPKSILTDFVGRPILMLVLEPMLFLLTLYTSFVYGLLYLLFGAVPIEFSQKRGWSPGVASLPFISVFIGAFIGCCITWAFVPRYNRQMHAGRLPAVPEERLIPMSIGAVFFAVGLFGFGWTDVNYVQTWVPSVIFLGCVGCGVLLLFLQAINYIVDAYLMHANSAIAGNTFMRSFFGAGFPLFTAAMFHNLGVQWASTLLGCIAVVMLPIPPIFFFYGKHLRQMSKFAPGIDPSA